MILLNDFKAEPPELIQQELEAVKRVVQSGWYVLGNEVKQFESSWAKCCDAAHAVGVGNGMDAIEIGLRASGIGVGDEVITTPMTAFATVLGILRAGATPVLADIDPETALLDMKSVDRCISPKTRALLLVHLYGQVGDMAAWQVFCSSRGILLLEDCAQAHLARWNGQAAGSFGLWGAYSFYPTKNLGALGDGGALVTGSSEIADQAMSLRNYGQSERYHHPLLGMNSRLDELQAAVLIVRLAWLDSFTARRREIANAYFSGISNGAVKLLSRPLHEENHVYHLFVLLSEEPQRLAAHLKLHGITSFSHYPVPVHLQPPCTELRADPSGLRHAEMHADRCLTIPCHPQMTDDQVKSVIEAINGFR